MNHAAKLVKVCVTSKFSPLTGIDSLVASRMSPNAHPHLSYRHSYQSCCTATTKFAGDIPVDYISWYPVTGPRIAEPTPRAVH